ncbi:MAG: gamma-glutamylcyclotransferase family protein [Acidimicrobiales bacterium]
MSTLVPYFAYGSNLDASQMANRCPGAVPGEVARLDGWAFRIGHRGVATIEPATGGVVWGGLWTVTDAHLAALDVAEGVAIGRYRRERLLVRAGTTPIEAVVYVEDFVEAGPPRTGYLERILRGAEQFGLPATYRAELEDLAG